MALLIKNSIALFLLCNSICLKAQDDIRITKVELKREKLVVTFYNAGKGKAFAPNFSLRADPNNKGYLSEKYIQINGDSLFITLAKKIDPSEYTIRSAEYSPEPNKPILYYNDKELQPKKFYRTSTCIKQKFRHLVITYDYLTMTYDL